MSESNPEMATARRYAASISRFKKEKLLLQLSEDEFRDRVVRPLFQRMGLKDGRDLCGPDEEGKDCIFFGADPLQQRILYAVQTKKGKLNMSRRATENVTEAVSQLRTALQTEVCIATTRERLLPQFVVLCASGEINKTAREFIVKTLNDTRLVFWDAAEFIPKLDALYPEYWYGIDADKFPYYRRLKDSLESLNDYLFLDSDPDAPTRCPVTDDNFVPLYLYRATPGVKIGGQRKPAKPFEGMPVQAVVRKVEKLSLIVGDAGSGKSTALRRLAYSIATEALLKDQVGDIPVLVKAADVAAADARLMDVAAAATAKLSPTRQVVCVSPEDMRKGRVVLLIDALDEIGDPKQREAVIAKVAAFHDEYKGCPIVVASRRYAYPGQEGEYRRFVTYEIKPFNLAQAQKLVTHLVRNRSSSPVNAQEVLRRLKEVHGIDLNPLFVTLFVAIADVNAKEIPANITELFKKYTELMLGRWDVTKGFAQQYQYPLKDHLLQIVAHRMHAAKATRMPLAEARALINKELEDTGHEADAGTRGSRPSPAAVTRAGSAG